MDSVAASRVAPPTAVRVVRGVMVVLLAVYTAWLKLPFLGGAVHENNVRDIGSLIPLLVAIVLLATCAPSWSRRTGAWACLALACAFWSAGDIWYLLVVQNQAHPSTPSWADAGYLALYPPVWVAIVLHLRRRARVLPAAVWLDGLVGGLAVAALASALVMGPILAATGGSVATVATNLSYPTGDCCCSPSWSASTRCSAGGRTGCGCCSAAACSPSPSPTPTSCSRHPRVAYVVGTTWDAGWPVGLAFVALAAWQPPATEERQARLAGSAALMMPLLCGSLGLGLLAYGCVTDPSMASVILATGCVLGALLRTVLTFRELEGLAQARKEAATDDLTGLANRRHFYARLTADLASRPQERQLAVLLVDLDRFKEVNDSLGHHVGDLLLQLVVQARSASCATATCWPASVATSSRRRRDRRQPRRRPRPSPTAMRHVLEAPFGIEGTACTSTRASASRCQSSTAPTPRPCCATPTSRCTRPRTTAAAGAHYTPRRATSTSPTGSATPRALRTAGRSGQLVLHYQPKIELATGRVAGVEALVRWQHPERGLVFTRTSSCPLAEAAGLMPALTESVLVQALGQCSAWRRAGRDLTVAVNLSPSNLLDPDLPDHIMALLAESGLPVSALHLEITEQMVMIDPERSLSVLRLLHAYGLRLAIDDYGAGHSSLTYLTALPVQDLKLDKSFVIAMAGEGAPADRAEAIVKSTVKLADALGLDLIAEGVETAEVLAKLTGMGCAMAQGYYLARPQPAADFERWLDRSCRPARQRWADQSAARLSTGRAPSGATGPWFRRVGIVTQPANDVHDTRPSDVFAAFISSGLWPGMSRTRATQLAEIGITRPEHVTAGSLTKLPRTTAKTADRLSSSFTNAAPAYAVVELLVPAGLPPRWAAALVEAYGPAAVDVVRADPWSVLLVPEAMPPQADALAVRVLAAPMSQLVQDPRRGRALCVHLLHRAARDGHTMVAARRHALEPWPASTCPTPTSRSPPPTPTR